jgi:SAM-dependent methyltransferase
MQGFGPKTFGELYAEEYDALHNPGTTEDCVNLIADLAHDRSILELAIGSGRIALPLKARGIDVCGFDASPEMVELLKQKPGGEAIETWVADMADFHLDRRFGFAYLVFNTLYNLTTQDAQVKCFQCVADHLEPGGQFLIEAFMPNRERFQDNQAVRTKYVSMNTAWLEAAQHNPVTQTIYYQRIRITEEGTRLMPLAMRYVWPSELDLMAALAGFEPVAKWGGWHKQPLTPSSDMYVALYALPAA